MRGAKNVRQVGSAIHSTIGEVDARTKLFFLRGFLRR
jgi:hypothetical protein